jgi:hypothetical protein
MQASSTANFVGDVDSVANILPTRQVVSGSGTSMGGFVVQNLTYGYTDLSRRFKPQTHRVRRLVLQQFRAKRERNCGGS